MFVYTVNLTDIASTWSIQPVVWGKREKNVLEAMRTMESVLSFQILGSDCDNGTEFLNWHLLKYFKDRKTK